MNRRDFSKLLALLAVSPNQGFANTSKKDKIIDEDMRYLTAAYSTIFYLAAEMPIDFRE